MGCEGGGCIIFDWKNIKVGVFSKLRKESREGVTTTRLLTPDSKYY